MRSAILYYVADPMCSWCWGFASTLEQLELRLAPNAKLQLVLAGLAPDSDAAMDEQTKSYVQRAWRELAAATGASFNAAFWQECSPRRSTWQACRAVLAAGDHGREMFAKIQRAYYLEARNPSDETTLIALAGELGLDLDTFRRQLNSAATIALLAEHLQLRDHLGAQGFPTLVLEHGGERQLLMRGFAHLDDFEPTLRERGMLTT